MATGIVEQSMATRTTGSYLDSAKAPLQFHETNHMLKPTIGFSNNYEQYPVSICLQPGGVNWDHLFPMFLTNLTQLCSISSLSSLTGETTDAYKQSK